MKKLILLTILALNASLISAQVSDRTETDCNTNSQSIYGVLGQGKVLFIAADGFDCSICQSHASAINAFANDNKAEIVVWGAMNYKYSANVPSCTNITNWKNSYGWDNVFMFLDPNEFWIDGGYPNYIVIDPADSTIVYEGFSHTAAMTKAKEVADNTSSVKVVSSDTYKVYTKGNTLVNVPANKVANPVIEIIDITGKTVVTYNNLSQNGDNTIEITLPETMQAGIYFAVMRTREKAYTAKFYKN